MTASESDRTASAARSHEWPENCPGCGSKGEFDCVTSATRRREWRIWFQGVLFGAALVSFVLVLAGAFR